MVYPQVDAAGTVATAATTHISTDANKQNIMKVNNKLIIGTRFRDAPGRRTVAAEIFTSLNLIEGDFYLGKLDLGHTGQGTVTVKNHLQVNNKYHTNTTGDSNTKLTTTAAAGDQHSGSLGPTVYNLGQVVEALKKVGILAE